MGTKLGADLWGPEELPTLPHDRRVNEILVVLGAKGSGKSTWVQDELARSLSPGEGGLLVSDAIRPESRSLIVWDCMDEYWRPIAGHTLIECPHPPAFLDDPRLLQKPLRVRFNGAKDEHAHLAVAIAWAREGSVVVFEEAHRLCPGGQPPKWLLDAVTTARHRAVSIVFTSQRPARVPKDLVANADRVVVGRLGNEPDRRNLAACRGDARILNETADLAVGSFIET